MTTIGPDRQRVTRCTDLDGNEVIEVVADCTGLTGGDDPLRIDLSHLGEISSGARLIVTPQWAQQAEPVTLTGKLDNPPGGYPGAIRLDGDLIIKPWRYKGP